MNVWLRWLGSVLNLDKSEWFRTKNSATEGWYLITGKSCNAQIGHNDMVVKKKASPGYFS